MADELNKTEEVKTEEATPEIDYKAELAKLQAENERLRNANTRASADVSAYKKKFKTTFPKRKRRKKSVKNERQRKTAASLNLKKRKCAPGILKTSSYAGTTQTRRRLWQRHFRKEYKTPTLKQ